MIFWHEKHKYTLYYDRKNIIVELYKYLGHNLSSNLSDNLAVEERTLFYCRLNYIFRKFKGVNCETLAYCVP